MRRSNEGIDATPGLVKARLSFRIAEDSQREAWNAEEIKEEKRSITEEK